MIEHLQNGALKDHVRKIRRTILTSLKVVKNVSCIKKFDNVKNRRYMEH